MRGNMTGSQGRLLLAGLAVTLASGCFPLKTWYKPGGSVARMQSDLTDCQVGALNKVPNKIVTGMTPIRWIPVRHCHPKKGCVTEYEMAGGMPYQYDANNELRGRVTAQCMARGGYSMADIAPCPDSIRAKAPKTQTKVMPALTVNSCSVRHSDGSWVILTKG